MSRSGSYYARNAWSQRPASPPGRSTAKTGPPHPGPFDA